MLIYCCFTYTYCQDQDRAVILKTSAEVRDNLVYINYDIDKGATHDRFQIWVEITDSEGKALNASAFSGDYGRGIATGYNKEIVWDPQADEIFIDADINIRVYGDLIPSIVEKTTSVNNSTSRSYSRAGIILQSTAFPGLGLSRYKGNPHWLKGVAGYGCIASSIVFNKMASTTYTEYETAETTGEANTLLSTAHKQNNISYALGFTAIAIWITDLTWTVIASSDLSADINNMKYRKIDIGTKLDSFARIPLLTLSYSF